MKTDIKKITDKASIIDTEVGVFAVTSDYSDSSYDEFTKSLLNKKVDWEADPTFVMGKKIVPHGINNNLPDVIRDIMDDNNLAPGILEREIGLLYGDGPALYKLKYADGQLSREYIHDKQIQAWLDSWNYKRFIDMAMVEYKYMKGIYAKRYLNRGSRIGRQKFINKLEVIPGTDARLAWPEQGYKRLESVKYIYVGDFTQNCIDTGIITYPVYDPYNPFRHRVSVGYHSKYSFGMSFYAKPSYYGSLNWIQRSSDIPSVLSYLSENGITSAFHIHSPAKYWEAKREKLEKMHADKPDAFIDKKLDELKDETFKSMAKVLAGKKNTGKFIETVDFHDEDGNLCSWKVESIDQKIKDFIDAQIKISEKADSATTSGMGLHPSLSNIIVNGQLSSGSQMLYALKLYLASDTTIPEEVVFEPINQAIAANFPGTDIRMGFYHHTVMREQELAPENRVKETAEQK